MFHGIPCQKEKQHSFQVLHSLRCVVRLLVCTVLQPLCLCQVLVLLVLIPVQEKTPITNFTFMLPCIVIDFFSNNQPDALIIQIYFVIKLYMIRAASLPIIRSSLLYIWHPDYAWKWSSKTCMKLTSAECTVGNSWWWAETMPKTCTVLWQNKFG